GRTTGQFRGHGHIMPASIGRLPLHSQRIPNQKPTMPSKAIQDSCQAPWLPELGCIAAWGQSSRTFFNVALVELGFRFTGFVPKAARLPMGMQFVGFLLLLFLVACGFSHAPYVAADIGGVSDDGSDEGV